MTDEPAAKQPMTGRAKRNLVTAAIIGVLVVAAVVVGAQSTRPKMTGDTISQTFSSAEPCATAKIPLAVDEGADPQKTAETLFAAIKPIAGLTTATYNRKTATHRYRLLRVLVVGGGAEAGARADGARRRGRRGGRAGAASRASRAVADVSAFAMMGSRLRARAWRNWQTRRV